MGKNSKIEVEATYTGKTKTGNYYKFQLGDPEVKGQQVVGTVYISTKVKNIPETVEITIPEIEE